MAEPTEFDQELREQLRPRSAPSGFADTVMARLESRSPRFPKIRHGFSLPAWRWATAVVVIAGVVLTAVEYQHQQHIAGERARQQVFLALRITGSALRDVQQKVNPGSTTPQPGAATTAPAQHQDRQP